jgi:hypothetical protein
MLITNRCFGQMYPASASDGAEHGDFGFSMAAAFPDHRGPGMSHHMRYGPPRLLLNQMMASRNTQTQVTIDTLEVYS